MSKTRNLTFEIDDLTQRLDTLDAEVAFLIQTVADFKATLEQYQTDTPEQNKIQVGPSETKQGGR